MFSSYLKTALRHLFKSKFITLINVTGMAIGMAVFLLIICYANGELSFDGFHEKSDRIYRCVITSSSAHGSEVSAQMVAAVGPSLGEDFPEIEKTVRFRYSENRFLANGIRAFAVKNVMYSDSTIFDVFSFRLMKGNPTLALANPNSIVLSEATAEKLFGKEDPIGKTIMLDNRDPLTVTGIVENAPSNSHIQFNAFISFSSLYRDKNMHLDWNGGWAYYTYILLHPETDVKELTSKFQGFLDRHINNIIKGSGWSQSMALQPLKRIYLHSNLEDEIGPIGNMKYLILFTFIAILIFVIACINFINLTSTQLTARLRETGIRTLMGAPPREILLIFVGESVIMNMTAMLAAFILAESMLPLINSSLNIQLNIYQSAGQGRIILALLALVLAGILAGIYPAIRFTSMRGINAFKGGNSPFTYRMVFKKAYVVLQYAISIAMIICTLFLYKQLAYIRNTNPGFDSNDVIVIPLSTRQVSEKHELIKNDLLQAGSVQNIAVCSNYPGKGLSKNGYFAEGQKEATMINVIDGDEDLLPVLGLSLVEGSNFEGVKALDNSRYLVNAALPKYFGWTDPIGKKIERGHRHEVIGVVRDFNYASYYEKIAPLIISREAEDGNNYLLVRARKGQAKQARDELGQRWNKIMPEVPFESFMLKDTGREIYHSENNLFRLITLFTILAIFIAFLGLFALSAYETERQTKNIGIRKVVGSESLGIFFLFAGRFIKWIFPAFIIACPVAWYLMDHWLRQFAYKTSLSWWVFGVSGLFAILTALATISWQTWLASRRDPVQSLRYE